MMFRFTQKDRRIIRIALSHYAYADSHEPMQLRSDLVEAARLIARMESKAGDKKYVDIISARCIGD